MSYEVDNRAEVLQRLKDFERENDIDSVTDIRRSHGSRRHRVADAGEAEHLVLHADAAPGQLAADYTALANAHQKLSGQLDVVDGLVRNAARLSRPMHDGHGPIAHAIGVAFHERAEDADGALRALTAYRAELGAVVDAIARTLDQYLRIDTDLAQHMAAIGEQHG